MGMATSTDEMSILALHQKVDLEEGSEARSKILYLIGQLGAGGSERQLYYLLQKVDRQHCVPTVVVWNYNEQDTYVSRIRSLGIDICEVPHSSNPMKKLLAFLRLAKKLQPDVVHSFTFHTNFSAFCGALIASSVAVGSLRGDFPKTLYDTGVIQGRLCLRFPRVQLCNSSIVAEKVRQWGGIFAPRRQVVVRNGLDFSLFTYCALPASQRVEILAVGSLLPHKRWDRLIDAAAELKRRGYDFLIRIAGDGPLYGLLRQQIQMLEVTDCVALLGHCEHISDLLASSSFLVHTSETEGLPNAIIEAMACGRAIVTTDVGEVSHLMENGENGFVVEKDDREGLVARMAILLTDAELRERMGKANHVIAKQAFGLTRHVDETFDAYRAAGWTNSKPMRHD
ncbi:MAG: hypothetical protein NPIRA01_17160 [Nitrospirales bacterium]|nr:MAG: hypothetical protein NPIRA01_17160 [Nitrospirales bacterium]